MEISIKTMMIIVLGLIAVLIILAFFVSTLGTEGTLIDGLFDWFKTIGGK